MKENQPQEVDNIDKYAKYTFSASRKEDEIIDAFVIRINQLVSMVLYLAIIMFAYANYDYYFIRPEYTLVQEDGSVMNTCSNLLECFITLFNTGIRSGGGIGDLLP